MALPQLNTAKYTTMVPSLKREVSFRPYLVKEEKVLMMAMETQDQRSIMRAVKEVIKSCVFDDINVDKLAMFDIEALFLALRSKSVGENVTIKLKCDCEELTEVTINLDEIQMNDIEKDNIIRLTPDVGVTMRYPALSDIENIDAEGGIDSMMDMIIQCMDSIYDTDAVHDVSNESKESVQSFLDSLNGEQFKKLAEFFEELPSLNYNAEWNCVGCNKHNTMELKGIASFFT
jgi:PDZ domain-containing secreted protein